MKTVEEIVEVVNKLPEAEREKVIEYLQKEFEKNKNEEIINQEKAEEDKTAEKSVD